MDRLRKGRQMKIQKLLWLIAGILLLVILVEEPEEKKEKKLKDGTYRNVYLISLKEEQMTALIEGKKWIIDCPIGKEVEKNNQIVDLVVEKNKIRGISWKVGQVSQQVEAIDVVNRWIQLKGNKKFPLDAEWKAYQIKNQKITEMEEPGSLINWTEVLVTAIDGKVQAVVAVKEPETKYIKVLIHGEKEGVYHDVVRLTASSDYEVEENGKKTFYPAGTEFALSGESGNYKITCKKGKIRLLSLEQTSGFPAYRGDIQIQKEPEGYIVRNYLPLEEYLYSVVSSEMPSTYPEQALNAQAVCARTYALYQRKKSYYSPYGANVDDTVNSQVYNNVAETKESKRAVKTTQEQYLEYNNAPIAAYFYSTSCGVTSDAADVWIEEGENPKYLKGHFQGKGERTDHLSSEKEFRNFIESDGEDCFEKGEPWYRWQTNFSLEVLSKHLNQHLSEWIKTSPSHYRISVNGDFVEKEEDSIGKIQKIRVTDRSKGGVIRKLEITGTEGILQIIGEYQIRKALCPFQTEITLKDGQVQSCSMLPSAYFFPEIKQETLFLKGGGYGHGVGLSQNGAKAMANLNYGYEDILDFYYPGVTLVYGY